MGMRHRLGWWRCRLHLFTLLLHEFAEGTEDVKSRSLEVGVDLVFCFNSHYSSFKSCVVANHKDAIDARRKVRVEGSGDGD